MLTAQDQTEKLWEMARRMEPHLIRHQANMDKLMSLLMVHELVRNRALNAEVAAAAGGDGQAEHKTADVPGEKSMSNYGMNCAAKRATKQRSRKPSFISLSKLRRNSAA